jgi:hypothetical protein
MTKILSKLFLAFLLITTLGCEQWPLWVGNKEYIQIYYQKQEYTDAFGATVTDMNVSSGMENAITSPFISFDTAYCYLDADTAKIVLDGIRVKGKRNNFEIIETKRKNINIYEQEPDCGNCNDWIIQTEFSNISSFENAPISCVLVLDMSTSVQSIESELKEYAKSFVDEVVNRGGTGTEIAVVFFSSQNTITQTQFYNKLNISGLKTLISNYSNFQDRTALFQATLTGLDKLKNFGTNPSKCLVVFSDGGDNDTDNPSQKLQDIQELFPEILKYSIGLKGNDLDRKRSDDLESIASEESNFVIAKRSRDLNKIFKEIAQQTAAVYKVTYNRSAQDINTAIKFEFPVDKIR